MESCVGSLGCEGTKMGEYWYCGIAIRGVDTIYSYISDSGERVIGSYVIVPFSAQNTLRVGKVKTCAKYTVENAPYPVEHTKHIIREATAEEYVSQPPLSINNCYGENEDLDELELYIEEEMWDDVLEWACNHFDSEDEEICYKVIECCELCVKQNMPVAALNLGAYYYLGKYVEQDYKRAYELYKIAADAGEIRAICNCGYCFYYGRHQEIDYEEAFKYFALGALLYEDANCLYKLGDMYLNGFGTEKNEKYAYIMYSNALKCSEDDECIADAQFRVGKCLLRGIGVEKDVEKAHALLSYALINFYERRNTDKFVRGLIKSTKELLAEAQAQLDEEILD